MRIISAWVSRSLLPFIYRHARSSHGSLLLYHHNTKAIVVVTSRDVASAAVTWVGSPHQVSPGPALANPSPLFARLESISDPFKDITRHVRWQLDRIVSCLYVKTTDRSRTSYVRLRGIAAVTPPTGGQLNILKR